MELQQSNLYLDYVKSLKWNVINIDKVNIFYRHIPLMGNLAKIQRCDQLPEISKLINNFKQLHIHKIALEPSPQVKQSDLTNYVHKLKSIGFNIEKSPFLPTKTAIVDIDKIEADVFQNFSEAKRRAVRRAVKNNINIIESSDIDLMLDTKSRSAGFLGFITTFGAKNLWNILYPRHLATTLLAFAPHQTKPVGGIMLLFHESVAYYWIAGATHLGKKLFAPTLLVWEAMKIAQKNKCRKFDFIGVWDERLPHENKEWLGFTKFKEGFGGSNLYYPVSIL